MKKFALIGIALAGSLALAGCGADVEYKGPRPAPQAPVSGVSEADQNMNNRSSYNDETYCNGDTYVPLPNNEFQCEDRDSKKKKATPSKRPTAIIPPKVTIPAKPAAPSIPKAAPAPKAPSALKAPSRPKSSSRR